MISEKTKKFLKLAERLKALDMMKNFKNNPSAPRPLSCIKDPKDFRDFAFENKLLESGQKLESFIQKLPRKIDHTPNMTPVKDQMYLGSCVGFAVTAMKEWQETKEHNKEISEGKKDHREGEIYNLSEAWLYWKCKEIDYWPEQEGTSIRFAMKVLNKIGVPEEDAWPYNYKNYGEPKSWAHMTARWNIIESYWRVRNLNELRAALSERPVPIGIPCFREIIDVGSDGFIPYPQNPNEIFGGHAICAVGYNDKKKRIKFKNSWGKKWGDKGYGYINYKYVQDFLWDAWTCKDIAVQKDMLEGKRSLK